jgi:hypothetical protein
LRTSEGEGEGGVLIWISAGLAKEFGDRGAIMFDGKGIFSEKDNSLNPDKVALNMVRDLFETANREVQTVKDFKPKK